MNRIIRKIASIAGWSILLTVLVITLAFSLRETAGLPCSQIVVKYAGRNHIRLSENELIRMARSGEQKIIGNEMENIDTEAIEKAVMKNGAVLSAEAYKTIIRDSAGLRGVITLKVKHRTPVLRIFSPQGNYYVDKTGSKIPVSVSYAADVPVATGNVTAEITRDGLLAFVSFLQQDKFWKAQVRQIHVTAGGELILTMLVGNQLIEFGTTADMEKKFRNLRAFYKQVLKDNNWKKYSRIILKFENQVVAKKS